MAFNIQTTMRPIFSLFKWAADNEIIFRWHIAILQNIILSFLYDTADG